MFDCSLLWGMFCFALEMISSVIAKLPICIVSHPGAPDLSFYFYCSVAKAVRHLFIYCHKQQQILPQQHFRCNSYRKRDKIDKWTQPKTWSIQERYCCCLISDRCLLSMCANRHPGKEKYSVRLWTFSLCFWVADCSPSHEYQGQPASIIHQPAVLRCPYLHLYCRTSKWLSLFNIVAASPLQLRQLKDQPELCSGAKKCALMGGRLANL